jgi:hypothetical protein
LPCYNAVSTCGAYERAGVDPKACPVDKVTVEIVEKLSALACSELKEAAAELAEDMSLEDGIDGGLEYFMKLLPRDNMLCDVSVVLGEVRHARYDLIGTGLWYNGTTLSRWPPKWQSFGDEIHFRLA